MTTKRTIAAALALLLSLTLLLSVPGAAWAEKTYGEANRFNVVLVVDKSGSLCCENGTGTDPDGLRFDALRLFLALLTESGNHVGAVVFDEHIRYEAPLKPLGGMEEKKALIRTLEEYYPCYDTDIGSAMLRATEMLRDMKRENDLPCMILLFSDGMTDFTTGDIQRRFRASWANAEKAVQTAIEEGIVINGILLNVEGTAERGREEFRLYTSRTAAAGKDGSAPVRHGAFEEVRWAADLAPAFRRLYQIVTNAAYTGDQRVAFDERGEAEIRFTVPSFGVEEVNVIVEGDSLRPETESDKDAARVSMEIIRPDGTSFDVSGHTLENIRYLLCKIPGPDLGIWRVLLKGRPEDRVDVTMVGNPSLRVELGSNEPLDSYGMHTPYGFTAEVTDAAVPQLTDEQLGVLRAVLVREELATGAIREFPAAELSDSCFSFENIRFPRAGEFALTAVLSLGDFRVPSDTITVVVDPAPLVAAVSDVADMLAYGSFRDGEWVLALDELFGADRESGLRYTLSDDFDGRVRVDNGVLYVRAQDASPMAFTLTATDLMDQQAQISFNLSAPPVEAAVGRVSGILEYGSYEDGQWEIPLAELVEDPKGGPLTYTLSDDCGGAVTIADGILHARLEEGAAPLAFTLTATDTTQQSAKVAFDLSVPTVTATLDKVTNMMRLGKLSDQVWELPLESLFLDQNGTSLTYTLSDDCGGAVTVEDGMLRVDFHELREASFELIAENALGRHARIPFDLRLPGPTVSTGAITETIKTGLFQAGTWETRLGGLFHEPKGTALTYTLSDDCGGAAVIRDGTLHVDMKGVKEAAFTVNATDEYGMRAELPVTLAEKNMTPIYLLIALAGLLALAGILAAVIYLWRNYW